MKWIPLLITIVFSYQTDASENRHSIGGLYATGTTNVEIDTENDELSAQHGFFYEYHFNDNLTIHSAYIDGTSDFCVITCSSFETREASWKTWQLDVKGSFQMTNRWHIFGRLGSNYYETKISGNFLFANPNLPTITKSGLSYVAALGLEFRANNGFKFGFEAQHLPMDIIDVNTYGVFVGFSF